jgi:hypothetical protein
LVNWPSFQDFLEQDKCLIPEEKINQPEPKPYLEKIADSLPLKTQGLGILSLLLILYPLFSP